MWTRLQATWHRVRQICMNTAAIRVSACWKYDCVLACGFWSTKVHVIFQFAESSWNISPGKPASCSSLARLLAVAMFPVSYMFNHAWPSLQSWSAAMAMVASRVQLRWCHSPPGLCGLRGLGVRGPGPAAVAEDNINLQPLPINELIDNLTSSCSYLLDDLRRLPKMPFRCGLCVAPPLWQPRFPRVLDVRQATRHCHTWHTVVASRHSYVVCRDLGFYL